MVAKYFYKGVKNLILIEIDPKKLPGKTECVVSKLDDFNSSEKRNADTIVHCVVPAGAVHVFGEVPTSSIVRQEAVPLNDENTHVFPAWLSPKE
jgi:uncharacterized protein (DUF952 family)